MDGIESFLNLGLEWGLGTEEEASPRPPAIGMLPAHDARTTNPRKAQQKLGKLVKRVRRARLCPGPAFEDIKPVRTGQPLGGRQRTALAKARHSNLQGRGPPSAFGRGQRAPCESSPRWKSWGWAQECWGLEEYTAPTLSLL